MICCSDDRAAGPGGRGREESADRAEFVPFDWGYDPADPLDQAILATRQAVFPQHGLLPHP